MIMMRVIQAVNTSNYDQINGRSCIDYWCTQRPFRRSDYCRVTNKIPQGTDSIVGGHVLGYENGSPHVYITPILSSVNKEHRIITFNVTDTDLVRVPLADEKAILSDPENKELLRKL